LREQLAHFGLEAAPDDHHAVLVLIHVKCAARVPARGFSSLHLTVHPPPSAHDALDMSRRARAAHREQPGLGLRGGHAGQGADLSV
jgi:hypothetical protein